MANPDGLVKKTKEAGEAVWDDGEGVRGESKTKCGISLVASGVGVFYTVLLLLSAWYMLEFERKTIMEEKQDENDISASEAAQLIEQVPRCMVCLLRSAAFCNFRHSQKAE